MADIATLLAQATQGTQAWTTIDQHFQMWQKTDSNTTPTNISSPSTAASFSAIRTAFQQLQVLHLDQLYLSHILVDILQPWLESHLITRWWSRLDQFSQVQLRYFQAASAPTRFHPQLNTWILAEVAATVEEAHQSLQPLVECLEAFDQVLIECQCQANTLMPQFQRILRTRFIHSLNQSVAASTTTASSPASSTSGPLRRSELFHELLFKYYRLNFRAFHRNATANTRQQTQLNDSTAEADESKVDETMEAAEREALEAEANNQDGDDVQKDEEMMEDTLSSSTTSKSSKLTSPEAILTQFTKTCALLLRMHFMGSTAGDVITPSMNTSAFSSSSNQPSSSSFILPVDSWISPSHFLDFFFILIEKYLRHTCLGVWDKDRLIQVNNWIDKRIKPFLFMILMGEVMDSTKLPASPAKSRTSSDGSQFRSALSSSPRYASFLHWSSRLSFYAMESFGFLRIRTEIFDLVKEYPDSIVALQNLKDVLEITKQYQLLIKELAHSFKKRLLQPSTATKNILEQYSNLVLSCRILDASGNNGLLLGILDESGVNSYIKQRVDTVRNVVLAIWGSMDQRAEKDEDEAAANEEEPSENEEEKTSTSLNLSSAVTEEPTDDLLLQPSPPVDDDSIGLDLVHELELAPDLTQFGDDSDGEDGAAGEGTAGGGATTGPDGLLVDAWHPDPITSVNNNEYFVSSGSSSSSITRYLRKADILCLLIDLCGNSESRNEEILLLEYKNFMAERILAKRSRPPITKSKKGSLHDIKTREKPDPFYDTELEVLHLELMKLRFKEQNTSLSDTEVMIKDIMNSKRIRNQVFGEVVKSSEETHDDPDIHARIKTKFHEKLIQRYQEAMIADGDEVIDENEDPASKSKLPKLPLKRAEVIDALTLSNSFAPLILSQEFWPDLLTDEEEVTFKLPPTLQAVLDSYSDLYHGFKKPRELEWLTSMPASKGNICTIEYEMKDGRKEVIECEPIHVAILDLFAEHEPDEDSDEMKESDEPSSQTQWKFSDILATLQLEDEDFLKAKLQFWIQKGVLRLLPLSSDSVPAGMVDESDATYELVEFKTSTDLDSDDDDATGMGVASSDGLGMNDKAIREQEAQIESYVLGSLGNFASLTVDKLHTMMKTISTMGGFFYTKSEAELKLLLTSMTQRQLLILKDGQAYAKPIKLQAS